MIKLAIEHYGKVVELGYSEHYLASKIGQCRTAVNEVGLQQHAASTKTKHGHRIDAGHFLY